MRRESLFCPSVFKENRSFQHFLFLSFFCNAECSLERVVLLPDGCFLAMCSIREYC